ncbi:MAG: arylsulfatase [Cyclobacteriaceae bacterium]|nr:MAG: arylsulfatase [Cyclobacteriaceae bacterium]
MKSSLLPFIIFLLIACQVPKEETTQDSESPLNFIIIFCDDLGYGDLSSFGNPVIKTPNLDRMVMEGQKWTQFYVADPVCTPSRSALMTGRYPIRTGMTSKERAVLFPDSGSGLSPDEITIAEMLKQKEYATAHVGKWHLGHLPQFLPTSQGFDYYYGIPYSNDMNAAEGKSRLYRENMVDPDFYPETQNYNVPLMENEEIIEQPADQTTITKRYTEKAVQYIREQQEQPFFLYLAHSMPHIPLFASEKFVGTSKRRLYGDVIEEIDWSVGQVIATLKELGLEDNTIVMFSSDNGPWLSFKTHGGSTGPLRAGKGTTFEGGQRVPTIFWGPGNVVPGIVTGMGSTLDIINTFGALAQVEVPNDRKMDGFDLSPVLKGEGASPRSEFYYWAFSELHAVRSGPWKLHIQQREPVYYGKTVDMEAPELYHIEADISEMYDRFEAEPQLVANLQQKIREHLKDVEDATPDQLVIRIEAVD